MRKHLVNNLKLGVFVVAGLLFLVILLYMIGKNQHLFGSNYLLKARFANVQGLKAGHNVRYAGIDIGTVKKVSIANDTVIEVEMLVENKMKAIIRKSAVVSIGTEGFVGNKVVNIVPGAEAGDLAVSGDVLASKRPVDTDEMLRTIYKTNNDVAVIAEGLKATVHDINNSNALWTFLNDESFPRNLRVSAVNVRTATMKAADLIAGLDAIIEDVKNGKGSLGAVLRDSQLVISLNEAIVKINGVAEQADKLASELSQFAGSVKTDVNSGKGVINAILKDSTITVKLNNSLNNIEKGTAAFNQDMEALKHNILLRGYFKKLEKQKNKEEKSSTAGY